MYGVYISIVNDKSINRLLALDFSPRLQPWGEKNPRFLFVPTAEAVGYGRRIVSEGEAHRIGAH